MEELLARIWEDLIGRIHGPLTLRLILQPSMAVFFGIRDGLKDARTGRPAYFWAIFTTPGLRRTLLSEGWASVAKVFVMALILDTVYQLIVFRWVYPLESLIVAFVLALLPYILIRGPINRIARRLRHGDSASNPEPVSSRRRV